MSNQKCIGIRGQRYLKALYALTKARSIKQKLRVVCAQRGGTPEQTRVSHAENDCEKLEILEIGLVLDLKGE